MGKTLSALLVTAALSFACSPATKIAQGSETVNAINQLEQYEHKKIESFDRWAGNINDSVSYSSKVVDYKTFNLQIGEDVLKKGQKGLVITLDYDPLNRHPYSVHDPDYLLVQAFYDHNFGYCGSTMQLSSFYWDARIPNMDSTIHKDAETVLDTIDKHALNQ